MDCREQRPQDGEILVVAEPPRREAVTVAGSPIKALAARLTVAALLCACAPSAPQSSPEAGSSPSGQPSAVAQPLECTTQGYPCSLAGVPTAVLERSDALGDEAATRAEDGSSMPDVEAWLRSEPEWPRSSPTTTPYRFRLEGGRPVWVLGERALHD